MTMTPDRGDREYQKFRDTGVQDQTKVAVQIEGSSVNLSSPGYATLGVGFPAQVLVLATSTQVLTANSSRRYAHIANHTGTVIYVELGSAAVVARGVRLSPGAVLVLSGGDLWLGDVFAISSSGTATISVTELTT